MAFFNERVHFDVCSLRFSLELFTRQPHQFHINYILCLPELIKVSKLSQFKTSLLLDESDSMLHRCSNDVI